MLGANLNACLRFADWRFSGALSATRVAIWHDRHYDQTAEVRAATAKGIARENWRGRIGLGSRREMLCYWFTQSGQQAHRLNYNLGPTYVRVGRLRTSLVVAGAVVLVAFVDCLSDSSQYDRADIGPLASGGIGSMPTIELAFRSVAAYRNGLDQ